MIGQNYNFTTDPTVKEAPINNSRCCNSELKSVFYMMRTLFRNQISFDHILSDNALILNVVGTVAHFHTPTFLGKDIKTFNQSANSIWKASTSIYYLLYTD